MPLKAKLISMSCLAACFLASGFLSSDALAAKKFYKWVDEKGVTHYSERPPRGQKSQQITTYTGRGTPPPPPKTSAADKEKQDSEKADATANEQAEPIKDPKICSSARKNLDILDRSNRVRLRGENGELVTLSNEEKESQRKTALKAVKEHCK